MHRIMGELIAGIWKRNGIEGVLADGQLRRPPSVFREWITTEPDSPFKAEPGRYHLYVSLACPWAHRTLIMRNLKALAGLIDVSVVHWLMGEDGWTFDPGHGVIPDTVNGANFLHEIYTISDPDCTSRVTSELVPGARVVKAFNTPQAHVLAANPDNGAGRRVLSSPVTMRKQIGQSHT
jgi:putative glutathione S-transferase